MEETDFGNGVPHIKFENLASAPADVSDTRLAPVNLVRKTQLFISAIATRTSLHKSTIAHPDAVRRNAGFKEDSCFDAGTEKLGSISHISPMQDSYRCHRHRLGVYFLTSSAGTFYEVSRSASPTYFASAIIFSSCSRRPTSWMLTCAPW